MRLTYNSCRNTEGKDGTCESWGLFSKRWKDRYENGEDAGPATEEQEREWRQAWNRKKAGLGFGKSRVPGDLNSHLCFHYHMCLCKAKLKCTSSNKLTTAWATLSIPTPIFFSSFNRVQISFASWHQSLLGIGGTVLNFFSSCYKAYYLFSVTEAEIFCHSLMILQARTSSLCAHNSSSCCT